LDGVGEEVGEVEAGAEDGVVHGQVEGPSATYHHG